MGVCLSNPKLLKQMYYSLWVHGKPLYLDLMECSNYNTFLHHKSYYTNIKACSVTPVLHAFSYESSLIN